MYFYERDFVVIFKMTLADGKYKINFYKNLIFPEYILYETKFFKKKLILKKLSIKMKAAACVMRLSIQADRKAQQSLFIL